MHTALEPACADEPELFFPPGNDWGEGANLRDQIDAARAICARCPLADACLKWALQLKDADDKFAIIAGTLPEQRARMRRNDARPTRARTA